MRCGFGMCCEMCACDGSECCCTSLRLLLNAWAKYTTVIGVSTSLNFWNIGFLYFLPDLETLKGG